MSISDHLNQVKKLIEDAEIAYHRPLGSTLLLAVTKSQSVAAIREAYQLGLRHFGENYFQEAQQKIAELQSLSICWHFIGPIQSNKTKGIATQFQWVHSVNRLKIAELLNQYRPGHLAPLNICLQINLVTEATKSGINPDEALALAVAVSRFPNLRLRGLMTIPPPEETPQAQYDILIGLSRLMQTINQEAGLHLDTLSMGMSDDLVPAIKAGSTIVRIGRAIFGERR